jgi:predicted acyl esterase
MKRFPDSLQPESLSIKRVCTGLRKKGVFVPSRTRVSVGRGRGVPFQAANGELHLQPGHRIMVQTQSSLFPLYDRNPQIFVPNIFFATPEDFRAATMTVEHGPQGASAVLLPIVIEK